MVDFAGWRMPIQYSSIVEEHHAVRRAAGLFDIAHMGRLWFGGADAVRFLDHLLTNHVEKMKPGQVRYALVCRPDGGILDDVLVSRFEKECLLVVNGANRQKIVSWIESHRQGFDIQFTDRTLESFMLALQGPQSQALLQPHVDCDLSAIRYYHTLRTQAFGVAAVISRTGYTGEDGFELTLANADACGVWTKLIELGEPISLRPCGLGCRDTLRLEAAMPLYGHEMDENVDPYTAGLSFGVKLEKGEFIGRDRLRELASRQDLPRRVGIELEGKRIARQGCELFSGDNSLGSTTSGSFSPTLEKSIAMGYVRPEFSAPGTAIDVDIRGKREPAKVVALPFYKRQ
jgi:aminomethyltransferase